MSGLETGSCLCGQLHFSAPRPLRPVIACHCSQCRKTSGHFVAATSAARDTVVIKGEVTCYRSSPQARRGFCGICGSQMFWDGPGENIAIFAGSLYGDTGTALVGHIFCADKGDYYQINDGLTQAEADDPALTKQFYK